MNSRLANRAVLLTTLAVCAALASGCAGLRCPQSCPRIDPSGERLFIWPRHQAATATPAPINPTVPPVYTDRVFPPPTTTVAGQPISGLVPPVPQDRLTITPGRVLAPVGSEVILKAGLCTRDNYLLTDSKIEWLLARDEVGEFVELGGRGWCKDPWLPWNKPKKIDNNYATGYTAKVPLQITRGTAAPSDDVEVQPGEAWASITSPVEGTSRITAVAPEIAEWANRRATATIYWVDVQWTFPPQTVTAGGSQVLTTTVLRHTDGTPIEGWIVRYEVADGGGTLRGNQAGQFVDVPTDADGKASIDVTPTGSGGTTTRINAQLVRPERFAGSNAPRLVIANGSTLINWTDGSDYVPPPDDLGSPLPPTTFPGGGNTPPISPTPAPPQASIGPRLELEIYPARSQVQVGEQVRFEISIRNTGDQTATGVRLSDRYDAGFTFVNDPNRDLTIQTNLSDIPAGRTVSEFLTFGVQSAGQLCHNFSVTYNGGPAASARECITAVQPVAQPQGQLRISFDGPRLKNVNEIATFPLSITNVGQAPLTNVEVEATFDRELQPELTQGAELRNGSLFWRIPQLNVGQPWRRDINCQCLAEKLEACGTVSVTADTGAATPAVVQSEQSCTEIRPASPNVVPPVGPAPGGDVVPEIGPGAGVDVVPNANTPLRMEILSFANPVRAGTQMRFQIVISNPTNVSDQEVQLRVLFPPELTPDVAAIHNDANVRAQFQNGELLFEPIKEFRAQERREFLIPVLVNQPGVRNVSAQLISRNMPQAIQQVKEITILDRS